MDSHLIKDENLSGDFQLDVKEEVIDDTDDDPIPVKTVFSDDENSDKLNSPLEPLITLHVREDKAVDDTRNQDLECNDIKPQVNNQLKKGSNAGKQKGCKPSKYTPPKRKRNFRCRQCDITFNSQYILNRHALFHRGKIFKCTVCSKAFYQRTDLRIHTRNKHKEVPIQKGVFPCPHCQHKSYSEKILRKHIFVKHEGGRPYVCKVCNKTFARNDNFRKHQEVHQLHVKSFSCGICKKSWHRAEFLRRHNISVHTKAEDKPYKCQFCNKPFGMLGNLKTHELIHTTPSTQYKCHLCEKSYSTKYILESHIKRHTESITFDCDLCKPKKSYTTKYRLEDHIKTSHCKGNLFQCKLCDKRFTQKHFLNSHTSDVHVKDPHRCNLCDTKFVLKTELKKHVEGHLKPFQCNTCQKRYKSDREFKAHTCSILEPKRLNCKVCNRSFMWQRNYEKHKLRHQNQLFPKCNFCYKEFRKKLQLTMHLQNVHSYFVID